MYGSKVKRNALGLAITLALTASVPALAHEPMSMSDDRSMAQETSDQSLATRDIGAAVTGEIRQDPLVSPGRIEVSAEAGAVTLKGEVTNMLAKERAADIARTVRGVTSVTNNLKVDPPFITDPPRIASAVRDALNRDPATEQFEINAEVSSDGVVTLLGTVETLREKSLARAVALGVKGVTGVNNEIEVEYPSELSDTEIAKSIEGALYWDIRVNDDKINVSVDNDTVTLSGTVGSLAEKQVAISLAQVRGVTEVDASALEVQGWSENNAALRAAMLGDKYGQKSPEQIEQAVEHALLMDPRANSFEINAEVNQGTVTLTGTTDNLKAKRSAGLAARHIVGVMDVNNRIDVQPVEDVSEREIARFLKAGFDANPWIEGHEIQVDVEDGVAELTGTVDNFNEKIIAGDIAARTPGVLDVRNRLNVFDADMVVYDPYLDHTNVYVLDWYETGSAGLSMISDQAIKQSVKQEIAWSPFVDGGDVRIHVDDGMVRLSGEVQSAIARDAATRNALEGGALMVDNDLEIVSGAELAGTR